MIEAPREHGHADENDTRDERDLQETLDLHVKLVLDPVFDLVKALARALLLGFLAGAVTRHQIRAHSDD